MERWFGGKLILWAIEMRIDKKWDIRVLNSHPNPVVKNMRIMDCQTSDDMIWERLKPEDMRGLVTNPNHNKVRILDCQTLRHDVKVLKPEDIRVLTPIPTPRPERANRGSSTSSMYLAKIFSLFRFLWIEKVSTDLSLNRKWLFTSQNCCRSGRQQGWGMALRKYSFSTKTKIG